MAALWHISVVDWRRYIGARIVTNTRSEGHTLYRTGVHVRLTMPVLRMGLFTFDTASIDFIREALMYNN